ncbi:hypothetical protein CN378_16350 [Bacillus sp. AFS015802]|uniref:hypothetical protein n=1 Tax=Bacillus sp. AFS015802 TaxID=2033486 RepID=UPI000BFA0640|nr:hypothetical protein [Bacillus sp. AFS015802]PFA63860.1 hypothetical protein CN378_16350 [Bacillus sp. AFS015802]
MNQSEWKDRDIEELIKRLPQIKDDRTSQYIHARMDRKKKRPYSFKRFIPAVAALAAIFILFLLAPPVLNQFSETGMEKSESDMSVSSGNSEGKMELAPERKESVAQTEAKKEDQAALTESGEKENNPLSEDLKEPHTRLSLYKDDLMGKEFYSFGLVSTDAVPIPVSVVDEPTGEDWLARHEQIAEELPEAEWGLEDYLPLDGEFSLDKDRVIFTLDSHHSYSGSSAVEYAFYHSLQYSFQHKGLDEVILREHDGSVPEFSSTGEFSKIDLNEKDHTAYYLYSPNGRDRFLVPDNINRGSIKESIQAMKTAETGLFQSVIPKDINFSVTEADGVVTFSFLNELDLNTLDEMAALEMIEGILLTSKSSGFDEARFENIKQETWNGFDFTGPIETPISPNKKSLINDM